MTNDHLPTESALSKLARYGLPLLAVAAVVLALGAVAFAHQKSARSGHDGDLVGQLSDLDGRLAAHRERVTQLSEMDIAGQIEARRAAERDAAAAAAAANPPAPRPVTTHATTPTTTVSTHVEGDDTGVIVLDCDIDSPLGCMDQ